MTTTVTQRPVHHVIPVIILFFLGIFHVRAAGPERDISTLAKTLKGRWVDDSGQTEKTFTPKKKYLVEGDSVLMGTFTFGIRNSREQAEGVFAIADSSISGNNSRFVIGYIITRLITARGRTVELEGENQVAWKDPMIFLDSSRTQMRNLNNNGLSHFIGKQQ